MENKETIFLTNAEYRKLLKFAGGNPRMVLKLPKIRNKDIIITDNLILRDLKIDNLDGVVEVKGYLDISNTNISNIEHINVLRYTSDSNTPIERARIRKTRQKRISELRQYEARDAFNIENDTELSNKVNALYKYFVEQGIVDPDFEDQLSTLETNLEELQSRLDSIGQDNLIYDQLTERIDEIEAEIYDLREGNFRLYSIYPLRYGSNQDYYIVVEGTETIAFDKTFIVLNDDECTEYAEESIRGFIDDIEISDREINYYIDAKEVREYFEGTIDEWVRDSPESYLDEDDRGLSPEQENQIQILYNEAESIKYKIDELEDDDEIEELRERLDEIESEIAEIEDDKDFTEEAIEDYINDWLDRIEDNPGEFLREMGYDKNFMSDFIDKDAWVRDIIINDGEETHILHGEGSLGYVTINNVGYSIFYDEGGSL